MKQADTNNAIPVERASKSDMYIRKDVLKALMKGSLEERIGRINEFVAKNQQLFLATEGDGNSANVIGTFGKHAIVGTSEAKVFRVEIAEGEDGMRIAKIEPVSVPMMNKESVDKYVGNMIDEMVDKFIASGKADAKLVEGVYDLTELLNVGEYANRVLGRVIESVKASAWFKLLKENKVDFGSDIVERNDFQHSEARGIIESARHVVMSVGFFLNDVPDDLSESRIVGAAKIVNAVDAEKMRGEFLGHFGIVKEIVGLIEDDNRDKEMVKSLNALKAISEEFIMFAYLMAKPS